MAGPATSRPIVHVVQHLRPGGLEVMALELARVQARQHPTYVVSLEGSRDDALAAWPRLHAQRDQIICLGKQPGLDAGLSWRLRSLFRELDAGGVHTHHIGPLLYAGPAARLAGVRRRIHTEHDAWHLQNAKRRRIAQLALRAARPVLVADAPHVADAVVSALGGARPRVILNGVDTDRFAPGDRHAARAALGLPQHARIIGIAARLERVKGVDIAVDALAELNDAVLAIGGTGSERAALEQQARERGVADRIRFVGHLDDTATLYRAVDVLCLPSRAEGLPLAPLEAQACGTPVVATRVGGVPAAIDGISGMLVDPENPPALAQALRKALHGTAQCDGIAAGTSARDFVRRTASLDAMASAYSHLMLGDGT